MILSDTDTLTHFSDGNPNVSRRVEAIGEEELAIAVITRYEVLRGRAESLLKAANEEELRRAAERFPQTDELFAGSLVVGFNEDAIKHFGRLKKQKTPRKMAQADLLIACISLANDALLVTRNTKDYKDITGLRIEKWVD